MINKEKIFKILKGRIETGQFLDYSNEIRRGSKCHRIKFGGGISISIDESSKVLYVNFAYNKEEKESILAIIKQIDLKDDKDRRNNNNILSKIKKLFK